MATGSERARRRSRGEVPGHLVVIGAGVIGLELGSVVAPPRREGDGGGYLDRIFPGMDAEIAKASRKVQQKQGMTFSSVHRDRRRR